MLFNNIDLTPYLKIKSINGRGMAETELATLTVPGMDGAHFQRKRRPVRPLIIEADIKAKNRDDLRIKIDELNEILSVNEAVPIVFPDESSKTYYGMPEATEQGDESTFIHQGTLTIICFDPYKYGPDKETGLTGEGTIVEIEGTTEVDPIFEMEVLEPVTFAMVAMEEKYQLIGTPADDEIEEVDYRTSVLYENGSTIDEWESASLDMVDDPNVSNVDGTMGTDDAGIRATSYGTSGSGQRGPAVFKELTEAVQDFELETTFDIISHREIENFRMMIYLYDENMNSIGQLGLKDNSRNYKRRVPIGTAGPHSAGYNNGRVLGDRSWHNDSARDTTLFYLRMKREGQRFSFYVGEWQNHRHINVWDGEYQDINNQYQGQLKYISLFIGSYQDRVTPSRLRMNSVELFELTTVEEDQTPYIARPGDNITFDHATDELLLNGEDITDEKDFGGEYFKLSPGYNTIATLPDGAFNTTLRYRPKYK